MGEKLRERVDELERGLRELAQVFQAEIDELASRLPEKPHQRPEAIPGCVRNVSSTPFRVSTLLSDSPEGIVFEPTVIMPGKTGVVDVRNPSVKVAVAAGMLVAAKD